MAGILELKFGMEDVGISECIPNNKIPLQY